MGISSGSGTILKPLGFMARIDKLGMRAITITKSFFMFFFMIKMVFRLTHKCSKNVQSEQAQTHFLDEKVGKKKTLLTLATSSTKGGIPESQRFWKGCPLWF